MWDNLTLKQKSDIMKMAIQQGISDLNEIKRLYNTSSNQFSNGGYTRWKDAIRAYKGIDPDMDRTYDYEGFYKENPREAWNMLSEDSSAHFTDKYKTIEHPTFSDQSKYSGKYSKFNPTGLQGGRWDRNRFIMSPDLYKAPVSMDERIDYLSSNEDEGVQLRESDGSLPLLNDGSYWGGVLPNVEVKEPNQLEEYRKFINNGGLSNPISYVLGNREYAEGGPLGNIYRGNGSKSQKMSGWRSSDSIRKRISNWEGASMHSPAPDTGKVNRPFEDEDAAFWNTIPNDIRGKLTQEMADALFSTSYNIGSGNFKKRVVPNLIKLFNGKGTLADVQNSMYGTRDYEPKMGGLRRRRAWEREAFGNAYTKAYGNTPKAVKTPVPTIPSRGTQYNPVELPEVIVTPTETSVNPNLTKKIERFNPFNNDSEPFYNYPIADIPLYNRHQLITPELIEYNTTPSDYILFGNTYAGGGIMEDSINWVKNKLRPAKRYIQSKTNQLLELRNSEVEAAKTIVNNFLAEHLLSDERRKESYKRRKEKAVDHFSNTLLDFLGINSPRPQSLDLSNSNTSKLGIRPNAYQQFNSNVEKKSREDYINDLHSMDKSQLLQVQKNLADNGYYDRTLTGNKKYIKSIQRNLIEEGYLPQGEDDGIVGNKTQKAYNYYLRDLNVDGKLGDKTIQAYINSHNGKNVSTKGIDGCAQWVTLKYESMADGKSLQNGVIENAWQMLKNIENKGGSILYNIYDDKEFSNIRNVRDLKVTTEKALKKHHLDYNQLQIGDVVGIYMPSSNMHETALKDGTTKNTHVGIVTGFDNKGIPIVEHNIHGSHRKDSILNISGSKSGKAQVTTVARPKYVNIQVEPKEANWKESKSKYTIDKKYDNSSLRSFADSMAGIAPQIKKIYPDVNMDEIQEIALAVQKRETNFMNNNTSKQGVVSQVKEYIGDTFRKMRGQDEFSKSSDLAKMKMSSLTKNERQFLGIKSKKDMEDPKKAGAAAALYLARNMNYLKNLGRMNPELQLSDQDIYNLTILSYNQDLSGLGFDDKGNLSPEEITNIRKYYDPQSKVKDVNSTKYKYLGVLGDILYEHLEDGFTPYIGAALDAKQKYIHRK